MWGWVKKKARAEVLAFFAPAAVVVVVEGDEVPARSGAGVGHPDCGVEVLCVVHHVEGRGNDASPLSGRASHVELLAPSGIPLASRK
jgi:hypothetical protein